MLRIENQAIVFALLCKYTVETEGEKGRDVIQKGMIRYGRERGARMAARAKVATISRTTTPIAASRMAVTKMPIPRSVMMPTATQVILLRVTLLARRTPRATPPIPLTCCGPARPTARLPSLRKRRRIRRIARRKAPIRLRSRLQVRQPIRRRRVPPTRAMMSDRLTTCPSSPISARRKATGRTSASASRPIWRPCRKAAETVREV